MRVLSGIIIFLLLPGFLFSAEPLKPKTGKLAANFTLEGLDGSKISLSDFKGRPVVLLFWTTWCPYCRSELKLLRDMHERLAEEGIVVLAINVAEARDKAANFAKANRLTFSILLDKETTAARSYGVVGIPVYILIDKDGYIRFQGHYFPREEYKHLISPSLRN